MSRKIFICILSLCLLSSLLLMSGYSEAGEKITITYWRHHYDPEVNCQKELAKTFMAKYPNIKVVIETFPYSEYETKVRTAIAGRAAPDIIGIDGPMIAGYAYTKAIIPLEAYYTKESVDDLLKATKEEITWNGHIWVGPLNNSNIAVFYNPVLFEKANIIPPKTVEEAWTWDEFLEAAKKLTQDIDGDGVTDIWGVGGMGLSLNLGEGDTFAAMPWIWQNGGEILSPDASKADGYLNSPESVEALQFYWDLFNMHKVATVAPPPEAFPTGKMAMEINGPWTIAYYRDLYPDFKYGIMPLPYKKQRVVPCGSWHMAVTAQSKHPKEAWMFVDWVTGKEGAKVWYEATENIAARKSTYEAFPEFYEYPMSIFTEQTIKYAKPRPVTPAYPVVTDMIAQMFHDIGHGQNPKTAADDAVVIIDKELARYK